MRKYKQKAALSLNPILDVFFLDTNIDETPFPSFKNNFRIKKSSSLKIFPRSLQHKPEEIKLKFKMKEKEKDKEEIVAGFRMSNAFGQVKRSKRSFTSEKNEELKEREREREREREENEEERRERRSATVMMVRNPEGDKMRRVLSNKLRQTINMKLEEKKGKKGVKRKEGLFQIVINSYRDFQ